MPWSEQDTCVSRRYRIVILCFCNTNNITLFCENEGDIKEQRAIVIPDDYCTGVMFFHNHRQMDELMEFLASFVRLVHADRYYKNLLIKNRGSLFLDIITASDIAYAVSLIKNSDSYWLKMQNDDGEVIQPLYTSGKGIKRVYGVTTWKSSGKKYYREVLGAWKSAFKMNHGDFKVLHKYWDKWIASTDGGRKFLLDSGNTKKTAFSVLVTRSEEIGAAGDDGEEEVDDHEDFAEYDSDPEENTTILSNWDHKRGGSRARNSYNDSNDDECGSGNDGHGGGGNDDYRGGGGSEEESDEDDNEDDAEESGDEDDDGGRSHNDFGKRIEEAAREEDRGRDRNKSNKRKQSVQPAGRVGTRSRH